MTTKFRKLLLDSESGLIPLLENVLNHEKFQSDFQLVSKEQSCINFSLGETKTKLDSNTILIFGQSIELEVQIVITGSDYTELQIKAAEFQAVVDTKILQWYKLNYEAKVLHGISEITGSASLQDTEKNPHLPPHTVEITAERKFEFQYFR